jgi:hypothetical protein
MDRRPEPPRAQRNRARIAQTAARLIAEHGLTDWNAAKRKACRQLGLPDREALPGNEEIEQALRDYNTLFRSEEQPALLRRQRVDALLWMERLSQWNPVLTGGVAAGWATAHSEIRLELEADDAKSVELSLINAGVEYDPAPPPQGLPHRAQLRIEVPDGTLRVVILSPQERRSRPRRDGAMPGEERMTIAQLRVLLDSETS